MALLGTRVRKLFPGHGWFDGQVVGTGFYKVLYSDGDEEGMNETELQKILVYNDTTNSCDDSSVMCMPESSPGVSAVATTPIKSLNSVVQTSESCERMDKTQIPLDNSLATDEDDSDGGDDESFLPNVALRRSTRSKEFMALTTAARSPAKQRAKKTATVSPNPKKRPNRRKGTPQTKHSYQNKLSPSTTPPTRTSQSSEQSGNNTLSTGNFCAQAERKILGSSVRKFFPDHGWFQGKVVAEGLYKVCYSDGDEEFLDETEVKQILSVGDSDTTTAGDLAATHKPTLRAKESSEEESANVPADSPRRRSNRIKRTVTPSPKPTSTGAYSIFASSDSYSPSEDEADDSDGDSDDDAFLPKKQKTTTSPKKKTTPSTKRRTLKRSRSKKVLFPPTTTSTEDESSPSQKQKHNNSKSVTVHGLPRGALAKCSRTGLVLRALESTQEDIGRCLIVSSPQNPDWVGATLESGADDRVDTSSLVLIRDPPFASLEFTLARAASAELLEKTYVVQVTWDGGQVLSGSVTWYNQGVSVPPLNQKDLLWALIEPEQPDFPAVLLGVPASLVEREETITIANLDEEPEPTAQDGLGNQEEIRGNDLLPPPSRKVSQLKLPASLLQKSIRRGSGLCSAKPLVEACEALHSSPYPGSTLAMLKTIWAGMLVDASPFSPSPSSGSSDGCVGLPCLLLLSLVSKADPHWTLPDSLRRAVVAAALRTAHSAPSQPWVGFVSRDDNWWQLEEALTNHEPHTARAKEGLKLRNLLRAAQAVVGGKVSWGKWKKFTGDSSAAAVLAYLNHVEWREGSNLPPAPPALTDEAALLRGGKMSPIKETRLDRLDRDCRLAALEPDVMPSSLVLLQGILELPPTSWKKHGLPSLSRQVRKLISEANPRYSERAQLARVAAWGKDKAKSSTGKNPNPVPKRENYESFREVVTPTGTLSDKELEVVECFHAIQEWQHARADSKPSPNLKEGFDEDLLQTRRPYFPTCVPVKAGPPLTPFDGRVAFLLAFASSIEIVVCAEGSEKREVVSATFCGEMDEPLLVQRIGKARQEGKELATAGGATSGATAVPSLGYVQKERSTEEARLMEAAEIAVAEHWKGGRTSSLPLPPAGMQWDVPGGEESVQRTAELVCVGSGKREWRFSIGGVEVKAFDARPVVSPCRMGLNDENHKSAELAPHSERDRYLRIALYVVDERQNHLPRGSDVLEAMSGLHRLAESDRQKAKNGRSEGFVYNWMELAVASHLPARTWRDALLAIRTREQDHVILGKGIQSDGTGAPRDMVEGVLVRMFHALEMLYPTALKKEGAMRFRVRPRGAAYYHLLHCLETLGRGDASGNHVAKLANGPKRKRAIEKSCVECIPSIDEQRSHNDESESRRKRPKRRAAAVSSNKTAALLRIESSANNSSNEGKAKKTETIAETPIRLSLNAQKDSPRIKTPLWPHQEASVAKVVAGVQEGKRGHADASAVGAGKTLTALATVTRLLEWMEAAGHSRHGVLVMLPTKALIREWLLEIATHTTGFHVIEQREDGTLFSLTYSRSHPPIDENAIVISTLDRVCRHPFVQQAAWDFVVIDECLSVQNAAAKRNPSAWRQIEVSMCGVLMLSATFFRSKYDQLFYMIRMLRSPLPRTMEWLPATIHEHIVCQIPETDRSWQMKGEMVPLSVPDLKQYRAIVDAFRRKQINSPQDVDGRKLWIDLETFLRKKYEGRTAKSTYQSSSTMSDAFARVATSLLRKGRRPLLFADTSNEAGFLLRALQKHGLGACTWASVASQNLSSASKSEKDEKKRVIVAVKTVEGQGINMQKHADCIICRPTPGDHLEQMKGRIDRPGQRAKELILVVVTAEHTVEEAKFANIRLAGNFFREYIAPVATKYRERIDLEATLTVGGTKKLKKGTVSGAWKRSLESAGQSGTFASIDESVEAISSSPASAEVDDLCKREYKKVEGSRKAKKPKVETERKYKPLNKVIRNKGDPEAVRQAKLLAKQGHASERVQRWLFPPKDIGTRKSMSPGGAKPLPKESFLRFSDATPPVVMNRDTVHKAVVHLANKDPKLAALIARVGADALVNDCGTPRAPTQARLFDRCVRAITFTMVSVDAGNAFMRRLAMKIGVCLEAKDRSTREKLLKSFAQAIQEGSDEDAPVTPKKLHQLMLAGKHNQFTFTHCMMRELVNDCEIINGEQTGYPHLCGVTFPCGKNDDPKVFLEKARNHANGGDDEPVSSGYSKDKASFIVSLVNDFDSGKISGEKIANASDREAAKMLTELKGIGDWCAGGVLMHFLSRADIMLYGDLTVRNYLNDLYDINHQDESETLLESAADFADTGPNRNLIDATAAKNGWAPYRSIVCYLMYHLQEENLVLL